mmetsp:Transcript_19948/g.76419  ORF Transcript_19948/g.76419 Transcript_19948/m.76419 type:complete len:216 (+) Transcript_19948:2531-3178(+)
MLMKVSRTRWRVSADTCGTKAQRPRTRKASTCRIVASSARAQNFFSALHAPMRRGKLPPPAACAPTASAATWKKVSRGSWPAGGAAPSMACAQMLAQSSARPRRKGLRPPSRSRSSRGRSSSTGKRGPARCPRWRSWEPGARCFIVLQRACRRPSRARHHASSWPCSARAASLSSMRAWNARTQPAITSASRWKQRRSSAASFALETRIERLWAP